MLRFLSSGVLVDLSTQTGWRQTGGKSSDSVKLATVLQFFLKHFLQVRQEENARLWQLQLREPPSRLHLAETMPASQAEPFLGAVGCHRFFSSTN